MDAKEFYNVLKQDFGHQTTTRQDIALQKLSEFILDSEPEELFLQKVLQELVKLQSHLLS